MENYINWLGQKNKDGKTNKQILTDCSSIEAGNIAWQAAQPQWQPIETAPKDGTEIDLFDTNNSHNLQKTGIRSTSCKFINGKWCKFTIEPDGMARFIELPYALQNPTHWQPLPPLPKTGE